MSKPDTKRRRKLHPLVPAAESAVVPPAVAAILPAVVPRLVEAVVPPVVAAIVPAVVQPVAKRLARIEGLLIEIRFEYDVQTKRINALRAQLDVLTEERLSKR